MSKHHKLPLHFKILIGIIAGIIWGIFFNTKGWDPNITLHYVKPFGDIFLNLLKMIAVPLVICSLIVGIGSLSDIQKLSRIGTKTITIYIVTTIIAITTGLGLVSALKPGSNLSQEAQLRINSIQHDAEFQKKQSQAKEELSKRASEGPIKPIVDSLVPENFIKSTTDNGQILKIVFFSLIFGIAMVALPKEKTKAALGFFQSVNEIMLTIVNYIMKFAPYGAFALIAAALVQVKSMDILYALFKYSGTVLLGLFIMIFIVYPIFLKIFTNISYKDFFKGIRNAQILAFSTSSSSATLPETMQCAENNLGVSKEVSSFVIPLGATINMDGTSLYQAVAAIFIAQVYGIDLSFGAYVAILLTATLASIGAAGVPSAGLVLLPVVLASANIPTEGIALVFATDRILDMFRTVVNVTGDSTVAAIVAKSEGQLKT